MHQLRKTQALSRRRFLERMGLGAGAALLSPIANTLITEAQGATMDRKRFIVVMVGNGLTPLHMNPKEAIRCRTNSEGFTYCEDYHFPVTLNSGQWTLPDIMQPVAKYKDRMLIVDGLANRSSGQHSSGFAALTCFDTGGGEGEGPAKGPSIDQFIASKIGGETKLSSLLYGPTYNGGDTRGAFFAEGPNKPAPFITKLPFLHKHIFGDLAPAPGQMPNPKTLRRQALLDGMRGEIKRLQAGFAGPERRKLDDYLAAIEQFDKRQSAGTGMVAASCTTPAAAAPDLSKTTYEDLIEPANDMGTMALVCGVTNVMGVAAGCGPSHGTFPRLYRLAMENPQLKTENGYINDSGHSPDYLTHIAVWHQFQFKMIARMLDQLSAIKEGDKTIFDNTTLLYFSENADSHHSEHQRWPLVVIGNAGGGLKADGRSGTRSSDAKETDLWRTCIARSPRPSARRPRPSAWAAPSRSRDRSTNSSPESERLPAWSRRPATLTGGLDTTSIRRSGLRLGGQAAHPAHRLRFDGSGHPDLQQEVSAALRHHLSAAKRPVPAPRLVTRVAQQRPLARDGGRAQGSLAAASQPSASSPFPLRKSSLCRRRLASAERPPSVRFSSSASVPLGASCPSVFVSFASC